VDANSTLVRTAGTALLVAGCLAGASQRDRLMEALYDYNDAVRWGQTNVAAAYLPREARARFLARHRMADLQIADYELVQIDLAEDKEHAQVTVDVTWALRSEGLIRQSAFEQSWVQKEGKWSLAKERQVGGTRMPEPAVRRTDATAARSEPAQQ